MNDLGRDARALLTNARGAHDAPVEAKARVRAGLAAALVASGGASVAGGAAQAASHAGAGAGWMTAAKIAVVIAVIGGGVALFAGRGAATHDSVSTKVAASTSVAVSIPEPVPSPAPTPAPAPAPVAVVPAAPSTPSIAAPRRVDSDRSVAAEVALLRRVSDSLRAGDAKSALAGVDEHARRFPNGTLAEEREMERIVALCALGRRDAAARATDRFARVYASSSYEPRIREACATTAPKSDAP
jgi:hypothetical protein